MDELRQLLAGEEAHHRRVDHLEAGLQRRQPGGIEVGVAGQSEAEARRAAQEEHPRPAIRFVEAAPVAVGIDVEGAGPLSGGVAVERKGVQGQLQTAFFLRQPAAEVVDDGQRVFTGVVEDRRSPALRQPAAELPGERKADRGGDGDHHDRRPDRESRARRSARALGLGFFLRGRNRIRCRSRGWRGRPADEQEKEGAVQKSRRQAGPDGDPGVELPATVIAERLDIVDLQHAVRRRHQQAQCAVFHPEVGPAVEGVPAGEALSAIPTAKAGDRCRELDAVQRDLRLPATEDPDQAGADLEAVDLDRNRHGDGFPVGAARGERKGHRIGNLKRPPVGRPPHLPRPRRGTRRALDFEA